MACRWGRRLLPRVQSHRLGWGFTPVEDQIRALLERLCEKRFGRGCSATAEEDADDQGESKTLPWPTVQGALCTLSVCTLMLTRLISSALCHGGIGLGGC